MRGTVGAHLLFFFRRCNKAAAVAPEKEEKDKGRPFFLAPIMVGSAKERSRFHGIDA